MSSSIDTNLGGVGRERYGVCAERQRSEIIAIRRKEMMKKVRSMPAEVDYELTLTDMVETSRNRHEITTVEDEEEEDDRRVAKMEEDKEEDKRRENTNVRKESKEVGFSKHVHSLLSCFRCFKPNTWKKH